MNLIKFNLHIIKLISDDTSKWKTNFGFLPPGMLSTSTQKTATSALISTNGSSYICDQNNLHIRYATTLPNKDMWRSNKIDENTELWTSGPTIVLNHTYNEL